jgi:hypothetical protein
MGADEVNTQLCIAILIVGCFGSNITAEEQTDTYWTVLAGPEKEKGKPVEILEQTATSITLSVDGQRGTARLRFTPKALPAVLSFEIQTIYDEQASEPPTQLFGTGDFRIFVGSAGNKPEDLTKYEGIGGTGVACGRGVAGHGGAAVWAGIFGRHQPDRNPDHR